MKMLLSIATLSTGCLIVPATRTTTTDLGRETETVRVSERGIDLVAESVRGTISIEARRRGDCERRVLAVSRVVETTHARMGGSSDPRGRVFGALLAPITLPISALITGLVVVSSEVSAKRVSRIESATKEACVEVAADLPVRLELPSGAIRELHTDTSGRLVYAIPAEEPYAGSITARVHGASVVASYTRPMPPVSSVREAARGCAAKHQVTGAIAVKITVGETGAVSHIGTDVGGADFASCLGTAVANVVFPAEQRNRSIVLPFELH